MATLSDFVEKLGGNRVISKILIANNGIGAVKLIRSVRRWAFEMFQDANVVHFVAMATPEDMNANAEYIRMASEVVDVPGGANNNNYANVSLILELAQMYGAHAVWAGWGHASENPLLPDGLEALGIKFIGPSGAPMRALGDKIGSTIIAQSAGVPCIAWNGDSVAVDTSRRPVVVPEELYREASVDEASCLDHCVRIGFPVMIKASEGGGGKGIRKVDKAEDVATAYRQVVSEIPGSPVFVMRLAKRARHLEVQLLADEYGEAIALNGRDCSVQRRHQKIIEEGPPLAAPKDVWEKMERAAIALAKAVGYSNAGTVEYLFTEDGRFAFLELNPRLQVEHPVTEMITKCNLPACQLMVAMGIPMHRIPDVRNLYGRPPNSTSTIDFANEPRRPAHGHCIAVRVTAENPDQGFQPTSGFISEVNFRSTPDVWGYFSVDSSGSVHEFADSQFGHLFASGNDRESARKSMIMALNEISIRGDIRTTVEYVADLLRSEDYVQNRIDTAWLDLRLKSKTKAIAAAPNLPEDSLVAAHAAAIITAHDLTAASSATFVDSLTKGHFPDAALTATSRKVELLLDGVKFVLEVDQTSPSTFAATNVLDPEKNYAEGSVRALSDGGYLISVGGRSRAAYASQPPGQALRLILDRKTYLFELEYDPATLRADSAAKLARRLVADGAHVEEGEAFAEVEVMKMYLPLKVHAAGIIRWAKSEGVSLDPGDVVATVELDHPDCVSKAVPYQGALRFSSAQGEKDPAHVALRRSLAVLENVLDGFMVPEKQRLQALEDLKESLNDPSLPLLEIGQAKAVLKGRIPTPLYDALKDDDDAEKLLATLDDFGKDAVVTSQLRSVIQAYVPNGLSSRRDDCVLTLLRRYLEVEREFADGAPLADVVARLRKTLEPTKILDVCRSRRAGKDRTQLVLELLAMAITPKYFAPALTELANLRDESSSSVALKAQRLLLQQSEPTREELLARLTRAVERIGRREDDAVSDFLKSGLAMRDVVVQLIRGQSTPTNRLAAIEAYVRKIYDTHAVSELGPVGSSSDSAIRFTFETADDRDGLPPRPSPGYPSEANFLLSTPWGDSSAAELSDAASASAATPSKYRQRGAATPTTDSPQRQQVVRHGIFAVRATLEDAASSLEDLVAEFPPARSKDEVGNCLHVAIVDQALRGGGATSDKEDDDDDVVMNDFVEAASTALRARIETLKKNVRRVTFIVASKESRPPSIFTFRAKTDFAEDVLLRHIEPAHAFYLELVRLRHFSIRLADARQTLASNVHCYEVSPKHQKKDVRFFVRVLSMASSEFEPAETEQRLVEALAALELKLGEAEQRSQRKQPDKKRAPRRNNRVYVNVVARDATCWVNDVESAVGVLCERYADKLRLLGVSEVEVKLTTSSRSCRVVATNPTGFVLRLDAYTEVQKDDGSVRLQGDGEWNDKLVDAPYEAHSALSKERAVAQASSDTLYCYDYVVLFEAALKEMWDDYAKKNSTFVDSKVPPHPLADFVELVVAEDGRDEVKPVRRAPGKNDVGMVSWLATLKTPEYPNGRQVVVIANDITVQAGSFGTREDRVFDLASKYSRERGLPRLYVAANSGARIGLSKEVRETMRVKWRDDDDPTAGFDYLYVDGSDLQRLPTKCVDAQIVTDPQEVPSRLRTAGAPAAYRLKAVIGSEPDLGVENLRGSGAIAGETARAYRDVVTLTLVVGRSVGIGAYLVRLGHRTIQRAGYSPIILTGYQALNKLLGKQVYNSNDQLGGPDIMYPNGVSHQIATDHLDVVRKSLRWLSYVPERRGAPLPLPSRVEDPVDRDVEWRPLPGTPYDPRFLLEGEYDHESSSRWIPGFFDKDSFTETLAGWAKTVVVGRARLGGVPVGVIITENRTAEAQHPADPADPTSSETVVPQAGGVWFPDSAHKTAQAIADFDAEDLPLMVFANWRGFSGGQRDMFDEILKFGARIVDGLVAFKQPVFVYIPPLAELRGGAWVVVDPTINSSVMEMYAAEDARGGVLEPGGLVEIKFREKDLKAAMHRLDPRLVSLDSQLLEKDDDPRIRQEIYAREVHLMPVYTSVAVHFADLHDAPQRMKAKEAIREIVPWKSARRYFYWRLKRKLAEASSSPEFFREEFGVEDWEQLPDQEAVSLLESHPDKSRAARLKKQASTLSALLQDTDPEVFKLALDSIKDKQTKHNLLKACTP